MWQVIKTHPLAAGAAVLVHVVILLIVAINIDWLKDKPVSGQQKEIEVIEAKAITEQELEAREKQKREAERQKREAELARERERKRQAELKKQAEEKKRQEALQKKREAEAKRQAELKKQREAEAAKRREEEARKQKELEAQRQREEELRKQREAEQRREQERAEQELQAKLKAEAEAQARREWLDRNAETINQYKDRIKEQITRQWRIPLTSPAGIRCEIMVRLLPGGEVANVQIVKGSGDPAFDQSVVDAVNNASPLPVPSVETPLFNEFREVNFIFDPKDKRL
ncbi:MAG: cell envelope integrity protein TolA [Thiohalophilus sp.]|jgi:colicin import membrane protein